MEKVDLHELQQIQTEILTEVDLFCRSNGIRYFLCYGSLIGAIRHKGFIPWDDDIDIAMPRPDYERFINTYQSPTFRVVSIKQDPRFPYAYAKIENTQTALFEKLDFPYTTGINIDLFPVDGLPDSKKKSDLHCKRIQLWRLLLNVKRFKLSKSRPVLKNTLHLIGKIMLLPFPPRIFVRKIAALQTVYDYTQCNFAADLNFGGPERRMDKSIFQDQEEVTFEGRSFFAPAGYDTWLRRIYGDYMQLPPKERRTAPHNIQAYRLNNKCTAYENIIR